MKAMQIIRTYKKIMRKNYKTPTVELIEIEVENCILAGSGVKLDDLVEGSLLAPLVNE